MITFIICTGKRNIGSLNRTCPKETFFSKQLILLLLKKMDNANNSYNPFPENISANFAETRNILESGPVFVHKAEQIVFTAYIFLLVIITCSVNGFVVVLITFYEELQTPHLLILMMDSVGHIITTLTVDLVILYMSLINKNPVRGNHWKCVTHRVFSYTPFLVSCHNLCLFSVERITFFYYPFWHSRVVTIRKIVFIEIIIIIVAAIYNTSSLAAVDTYFSVTTFLCSPISDPWVWITAMVLYFFLSVVFVFIAMISLYVLICKRRRAVACGVRGDMPAENIGNVTARRSPTACIRHESRTGTAGLSSHPEEFGRNDDAIPTQRQGHGEKNIKATVKLIASISGAFWLTFFPSVTGSVLILQHASTFDIELALNIKLRILRRFFSFFPFLIAFVDPILYVYVNPPLRTKAAAVLRRLFCKSSNVSALTDHNP